VFIREQYSFPGTLIFLSTLETKADHQVTMLPVGRPEKGTYDEDQITNASILLALVGGAISWSPVDLSL
jgi:hypothetical protein